MLPLSASPSGAAALSLGLGLAASWQAHLAGLIVRLDARLAAPLTAEGLSAGMIEDMMNAAERDSSVQARALAEQFTAARDAAGLAATEAATGAGASLTVLTGRPEDVLPAQARLADLTLLAQPDLREDPVSNDCLHNVLFESGRPVLVVPATAARNSATQPSPGFPRRACIAWNGTTEASSALAAALPFLRKAEAVRVLHAEEYQRNGPQAAELLPYLALHGLSPDVVAFTPLRRDLGAGLLAAATAFGADFLAMGAYSHSRLRQMILGGVTRHVLENARIAVLMSL